MKKILIILLCLLTLAGCVNKEDFNENYIEVEDSRISPEILSLFYEATAGLKDVNYTPEKLLAVKEAKTISYKILCHATDDENLKKIVVIEKNKDGYGKLKGVLNEDETEVQYAKEFEKSELKDDFVVETSDNKIIVTIIENGFKQEVVYTFDDNEKLKNVDFYHYLKDKESAEYFAKQTIGLDADIKEEDCEILNGNIVHCDMSNTSALKDNENILQSEMFEMLKKEEKKH